MREKKDEQYMYLKCLVNVAYAHVDALPPPLQVIRLLWRLKAPLMRAAKKLAEMIKMPCPERCLSHDEEVPYTPQKNDNDCKESSDAVWKSPHTDLRDAIR